MDRLEVNDLIIGAVLASMADQGFKDQAEQGKKIYEGQRAEIIANMGQEVKNGK